MGIELKVVEYLLTEKKVEYIYDSPALGLMEIIVMKKKTFGLYSTKADAEKKKTQLEYAHKNRYSLNKCAECGRNCSCPVCSQYNWEYEIEEKSRAVERKDLKVIADYVSKNIQSE